MDWKITILFHFLIILGIFEAYLNDPMLRSYKHYNPDFGEVKISKRIVLILTEDFDMTNSPFLKSMNDSSVYGNIYGNLQNMDSLVSGLTESHLGTFLFPPLLPQESVINLAKNAWVIGLDQESPFFQGENVQKFDRKIEEPEKFNKWVFAKFKEILFQASQNEEKLISNGDLFLLKFKRCPQCMKIMDTGIKNLIQLTEDFWRFDGKTTFLLTSMDSSNEKLTEFFMWGSGITAKNQQPEFRSQIHYHQIASLICTVLDLKFPSQAQGQIPLELIDLKLEQQIQAKVAKGLQVHQQCISYMDLYNEAILDEMYQSKQN